MSYRKLLPIVLLGLLAVPMHIEAQGFNGRARTYVSYLQVRDLVLDSIQAGAVPGEGTQRTLPDGTAVTCGEEFCQYYRSGDDLAVIPLLLDVEMNVWTGITGLRAYTHVRARDPLGDWRVVWPRHNEPFEALTAYVEYRRSFYKIRAGRQWQTTGLGMYNYDGTSVALRLPQKIDLELYGGLSLVRGLNEGYYTDLISDVENLFPREDAWLGGFHMRVRPSPAFAGSFTYQREQATRSGELYSERLAASGRVLVGEFTLDGEIKYDLATSQVNLGKLRASIPLGPGFKASGELRSYRPFFELWTIWGAFSPVGYDEFRARVDWTAPTGKVSAYAYSSRREYEDTHARAPDELPVNDDAWRWGLGGRYSPRTDLVFTGEYRADEGFGATRYGGDLSAQKFFGRDTYIALKGTAFETFSEFRVGSGEVVGGGVQGAFPVGPAKLQGGAMFYKHTHDDRPSLLDLNQARLNLSLEVPIGRDPGMRGGGN